MSGLLLPVTGATLAHGRTPGHRPFRGERERCLTPPDLRQPLFARDVRVSFQKIRHASSKSTAPQEPWRILSNPRSVLETGRVVLDPVRKAG
jgi:hypothetical protein